MRPLDEELQPLAPPRTQILRYLCLATFLGASLSVLAHGFAAWDFGSYWNRTQTSLALDNFAVQFFDDSQVIENIQAYAYIAYIETATSLLRLLAALLLWKQRAFGLFLYIMVAGVSFFVSFYAASLPKILDTSYTYWLPYISSHHLTFIWVICFISQWKNLRW